MKIEAIPAIPNRLEDGYGLNNSMVENLYSKGVKVIITVVRFLRKREFYYNATTVMKR